mmetsp:Transcript_97694/g.252836  ORF Transcript_97694/g.252836 Transcript_97694/m.252836 type:complete len:762 (+) Transcript_97694:265-2550(+)
MVLEGVAQGIEDALVSVPETSHLNIERERPVRRQVDARLLRPLDGLLQHLLRAIDLGPLRIDVLPEDVPRLRELGNVAIELRQVALQLLVALCVLMLLTLQLREHLLLLEEHLIRCARLLLQHLLLLNLRLVLRVGREEVLLVLLVPGDEVAQGVLQGPDLALRAPDLVVQVVALALHLLLLLGGLDHVVSLAHLLLAVLFFDLAHHVVVLALQGVDFLLALGQLDRALVPLLLNTAQLHPQHVRVHLDLLLALLHADLQLLLPVLQAEHVLGLVVQVLAQALHLQAEDVVLHQRLLLVLHGGGHSAIDNGVLELELLHGPLHALVVLLDARQRAVGVLEVRVLPLDLCRQDRVQVLLLLHLPVEGLDLAVELVPLLHRALAGDARHLALHQLRLEVDGVEQLLLTLPLLVQAADLKLEVLDRGLSATDLAKGVGLVRAEAVQLLALLVEGVLGALHLLLDHFQAVKHLLVRLLSVRALLVLRFRRVDRIVKPTLVRLQLAELRLVLLLTQLEAPGGHGMLVLRVVLLTLGGAELVLHDIHLVLERIQRTLGLLVVHADPHKLPVRLLDFLLEPLVLALDILMEALLLLHLVLLLPLAFHVQGVLLTELLELVVARLHVLDGLLPLVDKLFPVVVKLAEELSSLVHLDLLCLRLSDLVGQFLPPVRILHRELLDRERELPDLGVVRASVLLQRQLVFLLLPRGDGPLLQLLLVPAHLQLELIELLVPSHELVGKGVDLILLVVHQLVQAHDLGLEAAQLTV